MHMGKFDPKVLTLKAPIKICSRRHLNFFFYFSDDSYEMSRLVFSEK